MKRNIMKEAHEMTRRMVEQYGDIDYKTQLGLCLSFLSSEEGEKEEMTVDEVVKAVRSIEDLPVEVDANEWEKYGHHRIYVSTYWTVKATRGKFRENRIGNIGYFVVKDNEVVEFVEQQKGARYSSSVSAEIIEKCKNLVA